MHRLCEDGRSIKVGLMPMIDSPGETTQLHDGLFQLRQGRVEARNVVVERACERLRLLTRRMLRGYPKVHRWAETDDVLQGALIRLHRSLAEVHPESVRQFYGLAATQIRRELIDLARRHYGPEGEGANHHTDGGEAVAGRADGQSEPYSLEGWTAFHEQVDALPDEQREVVSLLWYEGLTQPEAADVLGVSLATLKRRWQLARIGLHQALKGEHPE